MMLVFAWMLFLLIYIHDPSCPVLHGMLYCIHCAVEVDVVNYAPVVLSLYDALISTIESDLHQCDSTSSMLSQLSTIIALMMLPRRSQ
jgi:hypothetical protein